VSCWPSMSHIRWSSTYGCHDIFPPSFSLPAGADFATGSCVLSAGSFCLSRTQSLGRRARWVEVGVAVGEDSEGGGVGGAKAVGM
jgi:hypothetical protein